MKRAAVCWLLCVLIATFSPPLQAGDFSDIYGNLGPDSPSDIDVTAGLTVFPILLIPLGGKYEGMGTAFTAVASDAGFLEANPSASALLDSGELVFLHNEWISTTRLEGVVYTARFGDLGIGAGGKFLYVDFNERDDWEDTGAKGYYSETVATMNLAYNFFSSYKYYGFSLGTNVKVAYRNIPTEIYAGQSAFTAMTDIGFLTRLNFLKFYSARSKNLSVGAVLKNLGFKALGEPLPTEATMGIAYSPIKPITVSFDATKPVLIGSGIPPAEWGSWGFAGGADVVMTDFFSLQGGFQTDGTNPRIALGGAVDLVDVSFVVNLTVDMTTQINGFDRFSVAATLNLGDKGRAALSEKVDEYYALGLEAYAKGQYAKAIEEWEKALLIDPKFAPAASYILIAKRDIQLQQEILRVEQSQ